MRAKGLPHFGEIFSNISLEFGHRDDIRFLEARACLADNRRHGRGGTAHHLLPQRRCRLHAASSTEAADALAPRRAAPHVALHCAAPHRVATVFAFREGCGMGQVELSDVASGKLLSKLEAFAAEHDRIKWEGPGYVEGLKTKVTEYLNGKSLWFL